MSCNTAMSIEDIFMVLEGWRGEYGGLKNTF